MIKFFRRIRRKMLIQKNIKKYLMYASGEILLIVIGILIALQVNSWNESKNSKEELVNYRKSLREELKSDIKYMNQIDSMNQSYREKIMNYINYYNSPFFKIDILKSKKDSLNHLIHSFKSSTYTVTDLLSTGKLSLFLDHEKKQILVLKNELDLAKYYERERIRILENDFIEQKKHIDLLYEYNYTSLEHQETLGWGENKSSKQYRLYNNSLADALEFYNFQKESNSILRRKSKELYDLLD